MKWLSALLLSAASAGAYAADLQVEVDGIESAEGHIRLALYNDPESFRDEQKSMQRREQAALPGTMRFTLEGLEPGEYALIVYHDADDNGEMNRFLGMIPTEGYGLSNNPDVTGPPRFKDARILLEAEGKSVSIKMKY
jgi:uncharacterized protein (DUF2141 family)